MIIKVCGMREPQNIREVAAPSHQLDRLYLLRTFQALCRAMPDGAAGNGQ